MSYSMETEKQNKLFLFDVEIICEQVNLQPQFIENQLLVAFIVTLKVL